jgi:hypothetical protein
MHVKRRLRAVPYFQILFLFAFAFLRFLSCFVWVDGGRGSGTGSAFSSIAVPILKFWAGHASENVLYRADPSN